MQQTIGNRLREARIARGLSLSDVSQVTKIPRASVEAIEAGDYDALPAPVFARGFVRAYAREVGVDAGPLIRALDRHIAGAPAVDDDSVHDLDPTTELLPIGRSLGGTLGTPVSTRGSGLRGGYVMLLVLAAGMLIAAWLMVGNERSSTNQTAGPAAPRIQEHIDGVSSYTDVESGPSIR